MATVWQRLLPALRHAGGLPQFVGPLKSNMASQTWSVRHGRSEMVIPAGYDGSADRGDDRPRAPGFAALAN
jgi:hypothetical protein